MSVVLYCDPDDLGNEAEVRAAQLLGDESPLPFEDGHALVEDEEAAATLVRKRPSIHYAAGHPDADRGYFDGESADSDDEDDSDEADAAESEGFDAEAFVDRTPMDDVIADIESGEYDEHLDEIAAAEADGRDRAGVADAIDGREE